MNKIYLYLNMSTLVIYPTAEQEKLITEFLEEKHIHFLKEAEEELPKHVLKGIADAQTNIAAGNFITHQEFKKRIGLSE